MCYIQQLTDCFGHAYCIHLTSFIGKNVFVCVCLSMVCLYLCLRFVSVKGLYQTVECLSLFNWNLNSKHQYRAKYFLCYQLKVGLSVNLNLTFAWGQCLWHLLVIVACRSCFVMLAIYKCLSTKCLWRLTVCMALVNSGLAWSDRFRAAWLKIPVTTLSTQFHAPEFTYRDWCLSVNVGTSQSVMASNAVLSEG